MITGRNSGSGKYSYQESHFGPESVQVTYMSEDSFKVRIAIRTNGETHVPIMVISETQAELLWASLKRMAEDLKWDDRMTKEILDEKYKS